MPHKSLVIFAKNREILKNSEKKCVLFLQKSLVICARNRWNPNENPKICLEKSLGISTKNQRNLKFLCFFHSRNHWWFPRKIYKFRKKSVYWSCRNHWWFLQKIDEIRVLKPNLDLIWSNRSKIAKNHPILSSHNWCPFGRRTFSSCFRAWFRFHVVKPVKKRQKSSNFEFSKLVSVWP